MRKPTQWKQDSATCPWWLRNFLRFFAFKFCFKDFDFCYHGYFSVIFFYFFLDFNLYLLFLDLRDFKFTSQWSHHTLSFSLCIFILPIILFHCQAIQSEKVLTNTHSKLEKISLLSERTKNRVRRKERRTRRQG